MRWPTWRQAFLAAVIMAIVALVTRRRTDRVSDTITPAAREFAGVAFLYGLWRIARDLPLSRDAGAIGRARDIWHLQQVLHLPSELTLQRFVLRHEPLGEFMNAYYAVVHVPALLLFLVWLWVRHRDAYPHWRNGLVATTAGCLVLRYVRVAPPRFLPDLGFVDLGSRYGLSVYGPIGTGVSDQMAAMPSIHCGWAAVVGLGVWRLAPRGIRWIGPIHIVLTFVVVAATGNHWWLDGIVAVVMLIAALLVDRRWRAGRSAPGGSEGRGVVPDHVPDLGGDVAGRSGRTPPRSDSGVVGVPVGEATGTPGSTSALGGGQERPQ